MGSCWPLLVAAAAAAAAATAAAPAASEPPASLVAAASAITVLNEKWLMHGAAGSWVGHGAGQGRRDLCSATHLNQSCTCNGHQADWVRANIVEALCNYQIYTNTSEFDALIDSAWPARGFDINAAAPFHCNPDTPPAMQHGDPGWPYYDDILWWALAMLRAAEMFAARGSDADNARSTALVQRSAMVFKHVAAAAWDGSASACGGGIWWSTRRHYKNAIANELFLVAAAKLGERSWAEAAFGWFNRSGMINKNHLVNDGLSSNCSNNGRTTFTYNQGVILGGLSSLHRLRGGSDGGALLRLGEQIIDAVLGRLVDTRGVLVEALCGDGAMFKGIFVRYLRYFLDAHRDELRPGKSARYAQFLRAQSTSVWHWAQSSEGTFGAWWGGKSGFHSATVNLQSAAIDALTAAEPSSPLIGAHDEGRAQHEPPCGGGGGGGESFPRVDWVAVPKALRARRVNRWPSSAGALHLSEPRRGACVRADPELAQLLHRSPGVVALPLRPLRVQR
eukprot:COSAG01_NODE_1612_length_9735_cov_74.461810_8_plen_506_part_00